MVTVPRWHQVLVSEVGGFTKNHIIFSCVFSEVYYKLNNHPTSLLFQIYLVEFELILYDF